ncbi:MAG: glycosyltransferase [Rhizobiales bacterium]|nr:glycosyltransferase [Hyphomicrobiales bacterium]
MKNRAAGFDLELCSAISARLERRDVPRGVLLRAYSAAILNGTSFCGELVHQRGMTEALVYAAIADLLDLEFCAEIAPLRIILSGEELFAIFRDIGQVLVVRTQGGVYFYIAPREDRIGRLRDYLRTVPCLRQRIRICTPTALAQVMRRQYRMDLIARAHSMTPPSFSAARVLETSQAFFIALAVSSLIAGMAFLPHHTLLAAHVVLTVLFFGCVMIRLLAAARCRRLRFSALPSDSPYAMPVYSVLVPLYREHEVVGQLIAALGRINWPRSKLDIKLVCEEDDRETRAEIDRYALPAHFEVIVVPPDGPRTKPKALNYALQFARGEIVAVFDAEDRPHPDQLLEAWQAFRDGGPTLACVQAPLIIGNFRRNLLTRMFAFEYAALFRGLLPWLSTNGLVIPLGGTSNHFRKSCLEAVGGWDAFNVTEDAELGVRLARFGYRIGVIARGTIEDAPESYDVWRRQRTRWIKGWMQTWLVHSRHPGDTLRQLGGRRFAISQIYMAGIICSALLHPLMLVTLAGLASTAVLSPLSPHMAWLLALDAVNLLLAYTSFYVLGRKAMEPSERRGYAYLAAIPVYWLLISLSAWRALWQLMREPHLWEKTPHRPATASHEGVRNAVPRPMTDGSSGPMASRSRPA